jgi:hypothetical protein
VTYPVSLHSFYFMYDVSFFFDSKLQSFILHTIGPTDLFHPSSVPHFKIFKLFLICLPEYARFSTIRSYAPHSYSNVIKFTGEKGRLLFPRFFQIIRISEIYVFLDVYDAAIAKYFPSFKMTIIPSFWCPVVFTIQNHKRTQFCYFLILGL